MDCTAFRDCSSHLHNTLAVFKFLRTGKKTVGVFTGPDLPNLATVATTKGLGTIIATFEAIESQTYYISVGKQTTDALLGWVITTLTLTPKTHSILENERAVRVRVETTEGKEYQLQVSSDLKVWENVRRDNQRHWST